MNKSYKTCLKKGDRVIVIAGKDKGREGRILQVLPAKGRLLVERVNMIKRHTKGDRDGAGGIMEKEASIHMSNVMFYDPVAGKGVRLGKKTLEDGRRVRIAKGSGEVLDR